MPDDDVTPPTDAQVWRLLGKIETELQFHRESSARIEASQTTLLQLSNDGSNELKKLASDIVDIRSRVSTLESMPHIPRPPLLSSTGEAVAGLHDSMRAMALDTKTQAESVARTEKLNEQQVAAVERTEKLNEQQVSMLSEILKSDKTRGLLFAAGIVVAGAMSGWVQTCSQPKVTPVTLAPPDAGTK